MFLKYRALVCYNAEGVKAGLKAASIACVASAIPTVSLACAPFFQLSTVMEGP